MSRAAWVAAAAEALRGHRYRDVLGDYDIKPYRKHFGCSCGWQQDIGGMSGYWSWVAAHEAHLAEALADALLPEVAETRVEWGVRWADPAQPVMPATDKRSAESVCDFYFQHGPVVVSRTVAVGAWEVAEAADVGAGIAAGVEVAPESSGSANGPQIGSEAPVLVEKDVDEILAHWRPGSQGDDWTWSDEYAALIDDPVTAAVRKRVEAEGIDFIDHLAPVLLGSDGRVWDGHHRIVIAIQKRITSLMCEVA